MATSNPFGWGDLGFDPDKCEPSWRQFAIDACDFVTDDKPRDDDPMDDEGNYLSETAALWRPRLSRPGFVYASPKGMLGLAGVIADYAEYERNNDRDDSLGRFALFVLRGESAIAHPVES